MAGAHAHLHPDQPLAQQAGKGHGRRHPGIAPAARIGAGPTVPLDTIDGPDRRTTPGRRPPSCSA